MNGSKKWKVKNRLSVTLSTENPPQTIINRFHFFYFMKYYYLTNSMAYGTPRFNAAFTIALR